MLSGAPRSRDPCQNPRRGVETSHAAYRVNADSGNSGPGTVTHTLFAWRRSARRKIVRTPCNCIYYLRILGIFRLRAQDFIQQTKLRCALLKMTSVGGFARLGTVFVAPLAVCRVVPHGYCQAVWCSIVSNKRNRHWASVIPSWFP
jgi:hypothetical protein